jgi:Hint module
MKTTASYQYARLALLLCSLVLFDFGVNAQKNDDNHVTRDLQATSRTVCTLCENGGDDFIPDRPGFFGRDTCTANAVSTKGEEYVNSAEDFSNCQRTQATIGEYCGCSNPIARSELTCPMCGMNTPLPDPTRRLGFGQTCAYVEYSKSRPCSGPYCGCNYDEDVQEYCCAAQPYTCMSTPCDKGASPLYPNAEIGLFGLTCGNVQGFIQNTALLQGDANCGLIRTAGLQNCGCPTCTLCEDGTASFDPSRQRKYANGGLTCAEEAVDHAPDTPRFCSFVQATIGEQCGCNNPVARANFECQLCGPGTTLPDPTRMIDSWTSCADKEAQYADVCYLFGSGSARGAYEVDFCCAVPTRAPVTAAPTTVKIPNGFCFSGETSVAVKHKGSILMKHLQIGDEVLTTSGKYEQVYSFGHRLETIEAEFLHLLPSGLEISRDHMVWVKGRFVPASLVQVGDMLESAGGNFVTVDSIERVIRNGVYAPFTASGTIIVSNIKASTYVAFHDTDRLHIGSWESPLTFQWLAHVSQSPHRLFTRLGWTGAEQYTVDGKSLWIAGPHDFAEWLLEQNGMVVGAVLVPALGLGLMSMAMEGLVSWFDSSSE